MDNRILELCKSVANSSLDALELRGVKCGMYNVDCHECPFYCGNRDDNMECYENKNKTREIARKYIEDNANNKKESDNMNGKRMKIIDIFNNWNNFKVDTEFYDEDIEDVIFSKSGYGDVVFEDDVSSFRLDYELIVREPVEYVDFDDIEVGEEFMMKGGGSILESTFIKANIFGEVKFLEKDDDGDIHVYKQFPKLDGFKFIKK